MFERFWRKLRTHSTEQPGEQDERRAHPRFPTDVATNCRPVSGGSDFRVRVRNVSRGGLNFLTERRMDPGTLLQVDLPQSGPGTEAAVLACVMHCMMQTDGQYSVGCSFSDELGDEELQEFGGRKEVADGSDKRAWKRFAADGRAEYLVLPPTGAPAKSAIISNISASGIGLLLDERIEPGTILDLLLKGKDGGPSFDMLACVVFLGPREEGGWVAGCHFIRELEEKDLNRLM
jgi:hypothetical protein